MTNRLWILLALCFVALAAATPARAAGAAHSLSVGEGFVDPLGFHDARPTLSWLLPEGVKKQTAYRIEVKNAAVVWDSGWVASDQSVRVPYGGEPLGSRQRLAWRVDFKNEMGEASGWSRPAAFELGLLSAADWGAKWIRPADGAPVEVERVSCLRRGFELDGELERARLYVTARGLFEVRLNGEKVGRDHFANGFTSYAKRLDSVTYDVTDRLHEGANALEALLGYGWYAGRFGWKNQRNLYGRDPQLLLQLEVVYRDGRAVTIVSDEHWEAATEGPIVSSSLYDGEAFDARRAWTGWAPVAAEADLGAARITPKPFAPVRETQTLAVQSITEPHPGRFVFDLGQNMVGWARLAVPMEADGRVTVRFAEMLNPDGTLHTANYRSARSTDSYVAAETGVVTWEPTFTFHGFRYVELSGLPGDATPEKAWVTGVVLHSDLPQTGTFASSHARLNRLQSNIVWGQRGNFLDIPTDCPQRDERAGWTGDAQVFAPTSLFNYDCHAFWKSWLASMRDDQLANGDIPHVIPDVLGGRGGSPGWVDAATLVPWEVYVRSGDRAVLEDNYAMMAGLVGWYRGQTVDGLLPEIKGFGDWLQPHSAGKRGDTPTPLIGLAFYARSCQVLAGSARVLGRDVDARRYAAEAASVAASFARHYVDADGRLQNAPETQTAYLLAIAFDLIPEPVKERATVHLVRLIGEAGGHLRTGFLGTPYLVRVLDARGRGDLALSILFKETYPSWFYSIDQGATTMWERWNSYSKNDGFSGDAMNSLNHYAYGAIGQWMVERIGGLAPDPEHPGYKHFFVRPVIPGQLEWARVELQTAYGEASSRWKKEGGGLVMEVVVPPNTTATIAFPDGRESETVVAGKYRYELAWAE